MTRSKPIIITQSIIAGLVVALGTAGLTDLVPADIVFAVAVLVGAVQAGLGFYLSATNTSNPQVLATQEHRGGDVVAGPASSYTTGAAISPGLPVGEITKTT